MNISIVSGAFGHNQPIPVKYTADGDDVSPPLRWSNVPPNTRALALIVDDPDAPRPEPWVHWVIYGMGGEVPGLPEGVSADSKLERPIMSVQGKNTWNTVGYRGPEPPRGHGVHHYHFVLYALDAKLDLPANLDKSELLARIQGHIISQGELIGTYER